MSFIQFNAVGVTPHDPDGEMPPTGAATVPSPSTGDGAKVIALPVSTAQAGGRWHRATITSAELKQSAANPANEYIQFNFKLDSGEMVIHRINIHHSDSSVRWNAQVRLASISRHVGIGNFVSDTCEFEGRGLCVQVKKKKGSLKPDGSHYPDYLDVIRYASLDDFKELPTPEQLAEQRDQSRKIGAGLHIDPATCIPPKMSLDDMCEELVYLGDGGFVAMRSNPNVCYPKSTFSDYVLPNITLTEVEEDGKKKMRNVPTFNLWMKEGNRRLSLHGLAFDPRYGEFCHNPRGLPCLNLFRPIPHSTPSDWQARVKPFLDHVEYLVPLQNERERFLDWLAHIEQRPGELPTAGYLMITETEGIGRNSLASVLARVWSGYVAMDVNINELLKGSFNDELACRFVAVVDEIREGTNEGFYKYAQRLKSMITATVRNLNPKYGRKREEHNCCRWLIFSNHWDALPIGEKDRRLFVIANPTTPKDPHYYAQLQRHIADPLFIHSVREWLRQRDISWFNPGEIPAFNSAKQMVIQTAKTEVEDSLDYIRANWISDCITTSQLCFELFGSDDKSYIIKTGYKAKDAGLDKYPERIVSVEFQGHKSSERVWILRNAERWIGASKEAVIAEMQRGMNEGRMK